MTKEINLCLKEGKALNQTEIQLINRINATLEMLSSQEQYNDFIEKLLDLKLGNQFNPSFYNDRVEILNNITKINIVESKKPMAIELNQNIKQYHLERERMYYGSKMSVSEFKRFVEEQSINAVFIGTVVSVCAEDKIEEYNVEELFKNRCNYLINTDNSFNRVVEILLADIRTYNNILSKINFESQENFYSCIFEGVTFSTMGNDNITNVANSKIVLRIIFILNIFKMVEECNKIIDKIEEELKREKQEIETRKKKKLKELEEFIKSDESFKQCSRTDMRIRYLKEILKDEEDEVLSYLDLTRSYSGLISARSNAAHMFINKLWNEVISK